MEQKLYIDFADVQLEEAEQLTLELQCYLITNNATDQAEIVKELDDAMNFGKTIVLILDYGTGVTIKKSIADWMSNRTQIRINISTSNKYFSAKGLNSKEVCLFFDKIVC